VSCARDRPNELSVPRCHPAEDKKGRARVVASEQVEQLRDLPTHARFKTSPVGPGDARLKRRDLKVFFEVDREMVSRHGPREVQRLCLSAPPSWSTGSAVDAAALR
jgi:hypothetical protein